MKTRRMLWIQESLWSSQPASSTECSFTLYPPRCGLNSSCPYLALQVVATTTVSVPSFTLRPTCGTGMGGALWDSTPGRIQVDSMGRVNIPALLKDSRTPPLLLCVSLRADAVWWYLRFSISYDDYLKVADECAAALSCRWSRVHLCVCESPWPYSGGYFCQSVVQQ